LRGRGEGRREPHYSSQILLPHFVRARHFFAHGSRQLIIKRTVRDRSLRGRGEGRREPREERGERGEA
jgi:hypothetical protein